MRLLLDSHVLLWWQADDSRLSETARHHLADRGVTLFWSTASTWELAIKAALNKLRLPEPLGTYFDKRLALQSIDLLPVQQAHAAAVADLPFHHRDPFDRMLIAQARTERLALLTGDPRIRSYDVEVVW